MLTVIVPTRGRPQNIVTQMKALKASRSICTVIYCVDENDPEVDRYVEAVGNDPDAYEFAILQIGEPAMLGPWLNRVAPVIARSPKLQRELIGFMGDDHFPRTDRWDKTLADACRGQVSIAYGNDLMQGPNLPTAVFMTGAIIRTLGWMVPPEMEHLYLDDAWKSLGQMSGTLRYFGNVIIEHMHPAARKAAMDEGYNRVNQQSQYDADRKRFADWLHGSARADADKIIALMEG
jgi:hypothetical protein